MAHVLARVLPMQRYQCHKMLEIIFFFHSQESFLFMQNNSGSEYKTYSKLNALYFSLDFFIVNDYSFLLYPYDTKNVKYMSIKCLL